jgi:hypothetical protein
MPIDPNSPVTDSERLVFGADAKRHPVTGLCLESGIGCAPDDVQALGHLAVIEGTEGKTAADAMRKRLGVPTPAERAAQQAAQAERVAKGLELLDDAEKLVRPH